MQERVLTKEEANEIVNDAARAIEVYSDFVQGVHELQKTTPYPSVQVALYVLLADLDKRMRDILPDEKIARWEESE